MKILYLTFYYAPDLSAGSFRNTALIDELAHQLHPDDQIDVFTTMPNRYLAYQVPASEFEKKVNIAIARIKIPSHKSDMKGQIFSFIRFFFEVNKRVNISDYDLVYASSSRLFTALLGAFLARKKRLPLYLDIRDIFKESILDVFGKRWFTGILSFFLTQLEKYTFGYASHINLVSEGFRPYFESYHKAQFSYFTNGIDKEFINRKTFNTALPNSVKTILYAGNMGEGQGLHLVVPQIAKSLGEAYQFVLIGDGGAKNKLQKVLSDEQLTNVQLLDPMPRRNLIQEYEKADFLFLHLNTLQAFERVLPSKIFEYACFDTPIIAGVGGYASKFIQENVSNSIVFPAGNYQDFLTKFHQYSYQKEERKGFKHQYQRETINQQMAKSIIVYAKK
jgi:glycosyltransferase involved in cell wall biosynthesis